MVESLILLRGADSLACLDVFELAHDLVTERTFDCFDPHIGFSFTNVRDELAGFLFLFLGLLLSLLLAAFGAGFRAACGVSATILGLLLLTVEFPRFRRVPRRGVSPLLQFASWRLWQHAKIFDPSVGLVLWVNPCSSGHTYIPSGSELFFKIAIEPRSRESCLKLRFKK